MSDVRPCLKEWVGGWERQWGTERLDGRAGGLGEGYGGWEARRREDGRGCLPVWELRGGRGGGPRRLVLLALVLVLCLGAS